MSSLSPLNGPVKRSLRASPRWTRPNSTSSAAGADVPPPTLPWPQYLSLRHKKRVYSQVASVPAAIGALFGGASYFGQLEADPTQPIMGIEPMYVYGGATLGCMGLGFLIGPSIGNLLFKAMNSSKSSAMEVMDKKFYDHIRSRRADPRYQNVNNPVPDYYGEKVSSIRSYRRWLRDQAVYKRKALHGMKESELGL